MPDIAGRVTSRPITEVWDRTWGTLLGPLLYEDVVWWWTQTASLGLSTYMDSPLINLIQRSWDTLPHDLTKYQLENLLYEGLSDLAWGQRNRSQPSTGLEDEFWSRHA